MVKSSKTSLEVLKDCFVPCNDRGKRNDKQVSNGLKITNYQVEAGLGFGINLFPEFKFKKNSKI